MICIGTSVATAARIPYYRVLPERGEVRQSRSSPRPRWAMEGPSMRAGMASQSLMLTSGASGRVNALFSLRALRKLLVVLNGLLLLLLLPFRGRARFVAAAPAGGEEGKEARKSGAAVVVRVPAAMVPRRAREGDAAARRAMAIRRMGVEEEEGESERTKRDFALFPTPRGDTLFTQSWTPRAAPTKGLVVLMHGLNEHSSRYNYFAKRLNESGFKVYAMDWIGHGGSDSLHGYVPSLDYAVSDLKAFLDKILVENPGLPCFCFGHSTGAAITLKAVLDPEVEARVNGVVLTSPAIRVQPSHPLVAVLAPVFSFLLPRYQFTGANKGPPVSRDPEALKAKYSDPLVFTGSIRVRTGYEILRITSFLQRHLKTVNVPFLVLHGTADSVTDPEASQKLYNEASSVDKSIKLYEGLLHDLLFEPERDEIAQDIIDWLRSRLDASSGA